MNPEQKGRLLERMNAGEIGGHFSPEASPIVLDVLSHPEFSIDQLTQYGDWEAHPKFCDLLAYATLYRYLQPQDKLPLSPKATGNLASTARIPLADSYVFDKKTGLVSGVAQFNFNAWSFEGPRASSVLALSMDLRLRSREVCIPEELKAYDVLFQGDTSTYDHFYESAQKNPQLEIVKMPFDWSDLRQFINQGIGRAPSWD